MIASSSRLSDFYYELPADRIAQEPVEPRDQSRLMTLDAANGRLAHHRFFELDGLLRPGDVLVANATRVFPARLRGKKKSGGKAEILLLAEETAPPSSFPFPAARAGRGSVWRALVRGATKETELVFEEGATAFMEKRLENGEWLLRFSRKDLRSFLERHGEMPLPPYIKRPLPQTGDTARYQTVYAKAEGAVAAPTAGFHFTPPLLARLKDRGVQWLEIILHVGWGTFRPIRKEDIREHRMLPESYEVRPETAEALNRARARKQRIIAVGTTGVRTLETVCDSRGWFRPGRGKSHLFITPGYGFKAVDALITNFHLPDATPLLLACAFYAHKTPSAESFALRFAYEEAIRLGYRFYSYGDAMLIQ